MTRLALATAVLAALVVAPVASARPADRVDRNIVQTAAAAGQFTTLITLAREAGLAGALQAPGPLTVFAPTDKAFAKVPPATLRALRRDKAALRRVLLYHVIKGRVASGQVVKLRSARTLAGPAVPIRVTGTRVRVGGALVTRVDVMASNGIIHVVDRVLIPPT